MAHSILAQSFYDQPVELHTPEQLDREIHQFQQTEFAEHKAECLARSGSGVKMPSPSATQLWRRGMEKWGRKWLERDNQLRGKPHS